MESYNQHDLVIRLRQDDVRAFDVLYNQYSNAVYSNIFKLVKDKSLAQDLLQETFIGLWEGRGSLDPARSVAGWLFTVSYNNSITHLKKAAREPIPIRDADTEIPATEEDIASWRETRSRILEEAIRQLSPQTRKVFELCKLQGKTYAETAEELKLSKHTVKEYLSVALAFIRTRIRENPELSSFPVLITLGALNMPF